MSRILFAPIGALSGLIAGTVAKKLYQSIWALIDKEDPPEPDQRWIGWRKLIVGLLIEGAVFRAVRGLTDHATRWATSRLTGSWPGQKTPETA